MDVSTLILVEYMQETILTSCELSYE